MSKSWFLIYQYKETGLLREMVDSRTGVGNIQDELALTEVPESKEMLSE